ncbi:DNA-dependent RNA polymerase II [Marasmius sp. AFHP31]|nr:DNA-dependent RNA polymerase II [Marasmius sp. AFHP31]
MREDLVEGGIVELSDAEEEAVMVSMTPEDLENSQLQSQGISCQRWGIRPGYSLEGGDQRSYLESLRVPSLSRITTSRLVTLTNSLWQAMGIFLTSFLIRMNTMANIQKSLATTRFMEHLKFRESIAGQNAIVDILCYSDCNQDDSGHHELELQALPKYLLPSRMDLEKVKSVQELEELEEPLRENMKHRTYDKLEDDGLIAPGTSVRVEDIIIGKTAPIPLDSEELGQRARTRSRRDVSMSL